MKSLLKPDTKHIIKGRKEGPPLRIWDIAVIGMMSAIIITVQVALSFLPNVELVSTLIILYTLVFGRKALCIIYIFVAVEGVIYGFGPWWINYLYVWAVLYFIVRLLRKSRSPFLWAAVSGIFGLCFGALCSVPYFIMGGIASGAAYWVSGIPFDIVHGIFNFIITLIVFVPFYFIMKKEQNV
jgi:energy-coupling factor transport system substrate-specific component